MALDESKWYIVQVVSNFEARVKEDLENKVFGGKNGENSTIDEIFLPMAKKKNKKGDTRLKPLFSGYLFVKVRMSDSAWYAIRNTQNVTGIVGSSGQGTKPTPIPEEQIQQMIKNEMNTKDVEEGKQDLSYYDIDYKVGDVVDIISGDFANKHGKVISINEKQKTVEIGVEFFGRITSIHLMVNEVRRK